MVIKNAQNIYYLNAIIFLILLGFGTFVSYSSFINLINFFLSFFANLEHFFLVFLIMLFLIGFTKILFIENYKLFQIKKFSIFLCMNFLSYFLFYFIKASFFCSSYFILLFF